MKYFMTGTNEEVKFGDLIVLDFTNGEDDDVKTHHHVECKLTEDTLALLTSLEAIEGREGEEETQTDVDLIDFEDEPGTLTERVEALEDWTEDVDMDIAKLMSRMSDLEEKLSGEMKLK